MKITVDREDFLRILTRTQGVVDRRHSMAILTNVVVQAAADSVTAVATDLEVSLSQGCPAKVEEGGSVAVSARKLFEIVRESNADTIALESQANHSLAITYARSKFRLSGIDPADHPGMPETGSATTKFDLESGELAEMVAKTIFAVSHDDTRSNLAGVYLDSAGKKGSIRMVATDGHRLALIDRKAKGAALKEGVILPRKGLAEIAKILLEEKATVAITLTESEAVVALGDCTLSMRLVEGSFPDYQQVVPDETPNILTTDRDGLLQTVRRVSLLSSDRAHGVRLAVKEGLLVVTAANPDLGEATEQIEVEYSGPEIEIGFNARYLLDVLAALPERSPIEIGLGNELSPGVLRGEDPGYRYVVMPMRI